MYVETAYSEIIEFVKLLGFIGGRNHSVTDLSLDLLERRGKDVQGRT